MKILLVGESGLGKTTFVRNLFAAYAKDASFPVNDASVPNAQRVKLALRCGSAVRAQQPAQNCLPSHAVTALQQFVPPVRLVCSIPVCLPPAQVPRLLQIFCDRPEALCTEVVLQDGENKVYYHYLVQAGPWAQGAVLSVRAAGDAMPMAAGACDGEDSPVLCLSASTAFFA